MTLASHEHARADFAERAARRPLREVMTPATVCRTTSANPPIASELSEDAPIAHAIALMAFENVHAVAVVAEDGEVVGTVTATDALRWTAHELGYIAPAKD